MPRLNLNMDLSLKPKGANDKKASSRGKLPTKRTINLAQIGVETINPKAATAGIILIVMAAVVFGKFLVADRLTGMFRANGEASRLQAQLNAEYEKIDSYGDLEDQYAHYTYSGMTEEELSLVDRASVIQMVQREAESMDEAVEWSLSGNLLTITVTGRDLEEINQMVRRLETYDLVNTCTVTNAVKDDQKKVTKNTTDAVDPQTGKIVRANILAYLQNPGEAEEEPPEGTK